MRARVFGWLTIAGLLSACAANSAPPASSASAASASGSQAAKPAGSGPAVSVAAGKFNFAYTQVSPTFLPLFYAQDAGYFKNNGLDVALQLTQSAPGMAALLSGQIEMSVIGGTELLNAASAGGDVLALASIVPVYPYVLEVQPDVRAGPDLKGKKVGITQFGSTIDVATRVALGKVGLTANDVTLLQLSSLSARTEALLNGAIQAGLSSPPDSLVLEAHGLHVLVDLTTSGVPATSALIVTRRSWLDAHHDQAQKAIDSLIQAVAGMKRDEPQTITVLKKYLKYDNQGDLEKTYDFYVKHVFPDLPYATPDQFKDILDTSSDPKVKSFDPTKVIDSSFVKNAEGRGVQKA
ncbi:MAG TPA: ABC transporter substrate-binding protein [Chloroflexota bacterium]